MQTSFYLLGDPRRRSFARFTACPAQPKLGPSRQRLEARVLEPDLQLQIDFHEIGA